MGRHIQKIINKIPKPPKITDNLKQLIRKGDLSGIKNTNDPKIINQIVNTLLKGDLNKIPPKHQDAFLQALLKNYDYDSNTSKSIDKLVGLVDKNGKGPMTTYSQLLEEPFGLNTT